MLDEAGIALWLRCEAIIMISCGAFFCPDRRARLHFPPGTDGADSVRCGCGLMLTRAAYQASYRHRALWQGNAAAYHRAYPALHTPGERLIAIDALIHSFHIDEKQSVQNAPR